MIGERILNYQIEKILGEEVSGSVYKAVDTTSKLPVLIRQIYPYLVDSTSVLNNLVQQFDGLINLQHPGIGKLYTYTEQAGQVYIISEYIEGTKLSSYIHSGSQPIAEDKVWNIITQLLDAFGYAHSKGIYHHSLSPDCIVIDEKEKVKVLGFGIAGLFTDPAGSLPNLDARAGNIQYQSPEQVYGKSIDVRGDIYSLGVILYEIITRQQPYPSLLSAYEIQTKICKDSLPLTKLYTSIFSKSYRMQEIIDKSTAKNPEYRYQNCDVFYEALQEEKDERESLLISEMMQHIAGNTHKEAHSYENSTIELAKRRRQWKIATQVFLAVSFLAASIIFIGIFRQLLQKTYAVSTNQATNSATRAKSPIVKQKPQAAKKAQSNPAKENKSSTRNTIPKSVEVTENSSQTDDENEVASAGIGIVRHTKTRIYTAADLQTRIRHFYEALHSKELIRVEGYYAPVMTRFFNEYAVEEDELKELLEKAWARTPEDSHDILWDTFRYYRDEKGNYIMDYYMNYHYRREDRTTWKKRKIYTIIKMDKDLRIYYMDGE